MIFHFLFSFALKALYKISTRRRFFNVKGQQLAEGTLFIENLNTLSHKKVDKEKNKNLKNP